MPPVLERAGPLAPWIVPIVFLILSHVFMTIAWYGHLRFKSIPLWQAVTVSWLIAYVEYWLAVPANRIGHSVYSAAQLKTIQEVVTLSIFAVFSVWFLKEPFTLNYAVGFAFIALGAWFIFAGPFGR
ncbi:MAG: DMT family protein [Geminicoccaceae bacterium]|nr:DMT family protein [Geminicoccaceae bacterium]